jgi:hypothetical protein
MEGRENKAWVLSFGHDILILTNIWKTSGPQCAFHATSRWKPQ